MKYYSEETKKFYNTEDELVKAEEEQKKAAQLAVATKKQLADAIKNADEELDKALTNYSKVKEEAHQAYLDALKPAKEAVDKAQQAKYKAVTEFNDKYGTYMVSYSGDRALKEFERTSKLFDNIFNGFFF